MSEWKTPREAPADGTEVRVWIYECDGFEHPETHYVCRKYGNGGAGFRQVLGGRHTAATLWRLPDSVPAPTEKLLAQSRRESEEDDASSYSEQCDADEMAMMEEAEERARD